MILLCGALVLIVPELRALLADFFRLVMDQDSTRIDVLYVFFCRDILVGLVFSVCIGSGRSFLSCMIISMLHMGHFIFTWMFYLVLAFY